MPEPRKLGKTRQWLRSLEEDRRDYDLAHKIASQNEPTFPLEEVREIISAAARTRHKKPRKMKK